MSNRLLIKSVICACDRGVFEERERRIPGPPDQVVKERVKVKDPVRFGPNDNVQFSPDLGAKKLTVTVNGTAHELPIDEYSLSLAGRD